MKDAKPLFVRAIEQSEVMIVDRILVRVLPMLLEHGQTLTSEGIRQAEHIFLPEALYQHIRSVTEELTGCQWDDA